MTTLSTPWYRSSNSPTRKVNVTNASTTVTGVSTAFTSNVIAGEGFRSTDGVLYEIASVDSDTQLTLATAYGGSTLSSQDFVIVPLQAYTRDVAIKAGTLITNYQTTNTNFGTGSFQRGNTSAPGINFGNQGESTTGFSNQTNGELVVSVAASERGKFTSSGLSVTGNLGLTTASGSTAGRVGYASGTLSYGNGSVQRVVVNTDEAQTLTNKTLTNPSFSGATANMGSVTTIDINGGTIDGTTIGASTPAAGTFTSLTSTGNTTLGDASGDTLTVLPSAVTWTNNPTHSGNHTFSGNLTASGNTTLGNDKADLITTTGQLYRVCNQTDTSTAAINHTEVYNFDTTATYYARFNNTLIKPRVATGVTVTGEVSYSFVDNMRNLNAAGSDDSGTLNMLNGIWLLFGHYNNNAAATPVTNNAYGLNLSPYVLTGSIGTLAGVNVNNFASGGTVTTASAFSGNIAAGTGRWNAYMSGTARNYMAGALSIGATTDPGTGGLYVSGNTTLGDASTDTVQVNGYMGVGTLGTPVSPIHVLQNNSVASNANGLTIEQSGTGDAQLHYLLTGVTRWTTGIDNSDSDSFKIGTNADLGSGNVLTMTTTGNVGIGTSTPRAKLHTNGVTCLSNTTYFAGQNILGTLNAGGTCTITLDLNPCEAYAINVKLYFMSVSGGRAVADTTLYLQVNCDGGLNINKNSVDHYLSNLSSPTITGLGSGNVTVTFTNTSGTAFTYNSFISLTLHGRDAANLFGGITSVALT